MNMKTISLAKSKSNPFPDNPLKPQQRLPKAHFIARYYCFYEDEADTRVIERESGRVREREREIKCPMSLLPQH